jgi:hypothetical protein
MVKPDFWDDEVLAQSTSRDARLTFIGIWNHSDDYGTVKGNTAWLKNKIFPYEEIKLDTFQKWLTELEKGKWIMPFTVDGAKYYYIRTFTKHQSINRPSAQRNPEPPQQLIEGSCGTHVVLMDETETETEVKQKQNMRPSKKIVDREKQKYLDFVFLADDEYNKLVNQFGEQGTKDRIAVLNEGIGSKGYKYTSHYFTILSWERKAIAEGKSTVKPDNPADDAARKLQEIYGKNKSSALA